MRFGFLLIATTFLLFSFNSKWQVSARIKFTNFVCVAFDEAFASFRHCHLKVVKRGIVALSTHIELYQIPVTNVSVNLSLMKKANGYRPFLYNVTTDFCAFMSNRKRYPILKVFLDIFLKSSNINHTCPFNDDIFIKNLILSDENFSLIPLPYGEYMVIFNVGAYNDLKANLKVYWTTSEH